MVVNSYFSHIAALQASELFHDSNIKLFRKKSPQFALFFIGNLCTNSDISHIIGSIFAINRQENSRIQIFFVYLFRKIGLFTTLNITENEIT